MTNRDSSWLAAAAFIGLLAAIGLGMAIMAMVLLARYAHSADYTRDGGTAPWMCCADKACTQIVSQHADNVYAFQACEALTNKDGLTRYVRSNAFRITKSVTPITGSATLRWTPPTQNTDGSLLTNLAGYRIVYGPSPTELTQTVEITNAGATSYVVSGLAAGSYYFAVKAYTNTAESAQSNVASKVIP